MSAAAALITSACLGVSGGGDACSKFLEASLKQTGIYENIDKRERVLQEETILETRLFLGDRKFKVVGTSLFLTKIAVEKSATINLPTFGFCDSIISKIGVNGFNFKIEWSF